MEDQGRVFLKGQFLVAMPEMVDPTFFQTVSCICEHTEEGAVGLVINKIQSILTGKNIFDELNIKYIAAAESVPVYIGGPVHIDEIFVLHGSPFNWDASLMINDRLAMSNTRDILERIAIGQGPESYMITLGCAGWGAGQLEAEIKQNAWLTSPVDENILFSTSVEARYEKTLQKMGIDPVLLSGKAGHA